MQGYRVAVGQENRAVGDGDRLRAKQAFGRPQADPVATAVQNAAQDGVGQVIEEQRRHALDAAGSQRQIGCLQRRASDQQVAERGEDLEVFAGVRVLQPQ